MSPGRLLLGAFSERPAINHVITFMRSAPLQTIPLKFGARLAAALILFCFAARAQRYEAKADPDSPEGQFLELIGLQSDGAKKIALVEQFTQRFPKHPANSWAYEQLQTAAFEAGQWDKALQFGERLIQLNPDDFEAAQVNIKAAESKGDKTSVKLWNDYVTRVAQRILLSPPPKDPELMEDWKNRTAIAAQYAAQDEYALYKKALGAGDPRQQIKLLDEMLHRNPDSPYQSQALVIYLNAYRGIGDQHNALATAEKILKSDQQNEDALLITAEAYLQRGGTQDKVVAYSTRLIDLMNKKAKPAGVRAEDWEKKRVTYIGTAHWMMGNLYINQSRWGQADGELRAALPLLRQSEQSAAPVLFYLGWANYNLENWSEAARFYKQCMAVHSQFQEQASKNLNAIRTEHQIED
jgi:tetratricopeptide (TPR) repeat protein